MRSAIGNSLLMNIVVIIVTAVILIFVGILSYSKAYRVKNKIIEVIEKYGTYDNESAQDEIKIFLKQTGYQLGSCETETDATNQETGGYKYCVRAVYDDMEEKKGSHYYVVTAYVEFNFPVINSLLKVPVKGETRTLDMDYSDY